MASTILRRARAGRAARSTTTAIAVLGLATTLAVAPAALPGTVAAPAEAKIALPAVPRGLPAAVDRMAPYQEQVSCDPRVRPGTKRLATLLNGTYRSLHTSWASTYACGTDGNRSEHYDGRAIDWMVSIRNGAQNAAAKATLTWLLAKDARGNGAAIARRLGIMYVIFNNRMWGSWSGRWEPYNGCANLKGRGYDSTCHRNHMHISLSWDGAMGRTSFWTKKLRSTTDYGPCRAKGMNWASRYKQARSTPCPQYPRYKAARGSSALKKTLVTYSGVTISPSSRGPAVSAVQRALHVAATGRYNAATKSAISALQRRAKLLPTSGVAGPRTWRALLAATR